MLLSETRSNPLVSLQKTIRLSKTSAIVKTKSPMIAIVTNEANEPAISSRNANRCIRIPTPSVADPNCATIVPSNAVVIASLSPAKFLKRRLEAVASKNIVNELRQLFEIIQ